MSLLGKIEIVNLVGRGGAAFPTAVKWKSVKQAKGDKKYVICNASEGEMGLFKDEYILEHYTEKVFEGMKLAMDFLDTKEAWFNINGEYYKKLKHVIDPLIHKYAKAGYTFSVYQEEPSYIGGEETTLLNAIEGKRIEPRLKPPFPSEAGLFGCPTLIHNVETLYNIASLEDETFRDKRFYCIYGAVKNRGVFHLPACWTIAQVLEETKNVPPFPYFVQIGGSASGLVLNSSQLASNTMTGGGGIEVYKADIDPKEILKRWFKFYAEESCGKCAPCRNGSYNLYELIQKDGPVPWKKILEIVDTMEQTSFCGLGRSLAQPVESYLKNVLKKTHIGS